MNAKLTHKALFHALEGTEGNISKVAQKLKVRGIGAAWHTIEHAVLNPKEHFAYYLDAAKSAAARSRREKELEEITARYFDEQESILDEAESGLFASVRNAEPWAIKYLLSTKGKKRGYDPTPVIKVDTQEPLNINFSGELFGADELKECQNAEYYNPDENAEG